MATQDDWFDEIVDALGEQEPAEAEQDRQRKERQQSEVEHGGFVVKFLPPAQEAA